MTYREQLNKVKELNISVFDLTIANELDCVLDFDYTEKQFEQLCVYAAIIYIKSENLTENAIARAINDMIVNNGLTVEQIIATDKWKFIGKAVLYM